MRVKKSVDKIDKLAKIGCKQRQLVRRESR